jgi:septum formation protein
VGFARLPPAALDRYLRIEQPYDCAGSFKAEGLGVALFDYIESTDPSALIGLPLIWLAATLRSAGVDPLADRGDPPTR